MQKTIRLWTEYLATGDFSKFPEFDAACWDVLWQVVYEMLKRRSRRKWRQRINDALTEGTQ